MFLNRLTILMTQIFSLYTAVTILHLPMEVTRRLLMLPMLKILLFQIPESVHSIYRDSVVYTQRDKPNSSKKTTVTKSISGKY